MKSNKGFTLIELLAVIVILAIIALIATPIILGVIDKARQGSAEQSALSFIQAVENQVVISQLTADTSDDITISEAGSTFAVSYFTSGDKKVSMKGTMPSSGSIVLDKEGNATNETCVTVKLNGKSYDITYDGAGKATAGTCSE